MKLIENPFIGNLFKTVDSEILFQESIDIIDEDHELFFTKKGVARYPVDGGPENSIMGELNIVEQISHKELAHKIEDRDYKLNSIRIIFIFNNVQLIEDEEYDGIDIFVGSSEDGPKVTSVNNGNLLIVNNDSVSVDFESEDFIIKCLEDKVEFYSKEEDETK